MADQEAKCILVLAGVQPGELGSVTWDILCKEKKSQLVCRYRPCCERDSPEILVVSHQPTGSLTTTKSRISQKHGFEQRYEKRAFKIINHKVTAPDSIWMFVDEKNSRVTDEPSYENKNGFKAFVKRRELIIGTKLSDMQRV